MSYGKLTVRMRVHSVKLDGTRWVNLLTCNEITHEKATEYANKWVSLNISKPQRERINVMWQENPILIGIDREDGE